MSEETCKDAFIGGGNTILDDRGRQQTVVKDGASGTLVRGASNVYQDQSGGSLIVKGRDVAGTRVEDSKNFLSKQQEAELSIHGDGGTAAALEVKNSAGIEAKVANCRINLSGKGNVSHSRLDGCTAENLLYCRNKVKFN